MTVTGYAPDDLAPTRPDGNGTGIPARRTAFDDLADQAARLPWCWPALITLAFGFYQVGLDLVALSVITGHIAGVVLRCWYNRDHRQLWFLAAVAGGPC